MADTYYRPYYVTPAEVFDNGNLSSSAKLLYSLVLSLTQKGGACFASNAWLAKKMQCSDRTIRVLLAELKDEKLIETVVTYKDGTKEVDKRYIQAYTPLGKFPSVPPEEPPRTISSVPPDENCRDSNTEYSNTLIPSNYQNRWEEDRGCGGKEEPNGSEVSPLLSKPVAPTEPPKGNQSSGRYESITKSEKKPRHAYGSFKNVLLTDEQYATLKAMFSDLDDRIENMSLYCDSHGKSYKNYYSALLNWSRMEAKRQKDKPKDRWAGHEY